MEKNKNIKDYLCLLDSKISNKTENHYFKLLNHIYKYMRIYKEYIELDMGIFGIGRNIGFKKRCLTISENELNELEKQFNLNITNLRSLNDNKINYDFDLWIIENEKLKKKIDDLEAKNNLLKSDIVDLIEEENKLKILKEKLIPQLKYFLILINNEKDKQEYFDSDINLGELTQIVSLINDEYCKELLKNYFILNIRLKTLIFNNIDRLINDLTKENNINEKELFNMNVMLLVLIGMDDREEIDLEVMINNPIFKDKISLLEIIFNYLKSGILNGESLKKFDHIKFVNANNMWFLELINLLNENNKNRNKHR